MSTIQTDGDGDGIEAPLDVPVPDIPGFDLDEIVDAATEMIERDMRRQSSAPVSDPELATAEPDTADTAGLTDQPDTEADEPPTPDTPGVDGEGAEAASDPGQETPAQPGSEAVGEPGADTAPAEPPPTDTPAAEPDEWSRVGAAAERLWGVRPTFDDLQGLAARAVNYDNLVAQIQQLPADQQEVLGQIIQGTFDPAAYAAAHAPAPPRDRDPLFDDDPAPAPSANDEVVRELRELRAMQQQQREDEWTRNVRADLERVQADFLAANPQLTPADFEQVARSVHSAGTWTNDLPVRGAYDAYGRHLVAHAVAAGFDVNAPGTQTPAAAASTSTPTSTPAPAVAAPGSRPVPADTAPITDAEQAHAQRRQAAAATVAGSSAPARATKRSVLDTGDAPGHPKRASTPQDLEAELVRAAEEMGLGG